MPKVAELMCKDKLTPAQFKRLGKRVHIFQTSGAVFDFLTAENRRQNAANRFWETTVWTKFADDLWHKVWNVGSQVVKYEYAVIVADR